MARGVGAGIIKSLLHCTLRQCKCPGSWAACILLREVRIQDTESGVSCRSLRARDIKICAAGHREIPPAVPRDFQYEARL